MRPFFWSHEENNWIYSMYKNHYLYGKSPWNVCAHVRVLESLKEQTFTMNIKLHGAVTSHSMNNTESGVSVI